MVKTGTVHVFFFIIPSCKATTSKFKLNLYFHYSVYEGIYLCLLPGEHDAKLLWPIKLVSIWILYQEKDHIERSRSWEWNRTAI